MTFNLLLSGMSKDREIFIFMQLIISFVIWGLHKDLKKIVENITYGNSIFSLLLLRDANNKFMLVFEISILNNNAKKTYNDAA